VLLGLEKGQYGKDCLWIALGGFCDPREKLVQRRGHVVRSHKGGRTLPWNRT